MANLGAAEVAKLLDELGQRLGLKPGNPYRARAYSRAAESLATLTEPLEDIIAEDRLTELPGVGEAIAGVVTKLHRTGMHPQLETLRQEAPASVLELLRVPGLRTEKALKLYRELGIDSLDALERAAKEGRLSKVKGFGPAFERKMLQSIAIKRGGAGRRHLHRAEELLAAAERSLRKTRPEVKRIVPAGEFRRGCELVSTLSLLAEQPGLQAPVTRSVGKDLNIHLAPAAQYGAALLAATGSEAHLAQLQALAEEKGLRLDASGLRRGRKVIAAKSEKDIYAALGLPFIAPELREGRDEIERAQRGALKSLVTDKDIRGVIHAHTDRSDGTNTLEEMAEGARERGYQYLGLTDHSQAAHYAGGLKADEVIEQQRELDALNRRLRGRFRVLKGIESDILGDGSLDYPDDILARFELIVASVHSNFRMERKAQTERILKAIANPFTTVLGHVTGRQLLRRPGYEVDLERILKACADHGVAVEINANPWRLDLDWRWFGRALELGCLMSIDADAHSIAEIDNAHWGVVMARKGGVPKERVLNCLALDDFVRHLEARRAARLRKRRPGRRLSESRAAAE
jgi:DNA polymerase (family 10)